jgi:hypothetical protein
MHPLTTTTKTKDTMNNIVFKKVDSSWEHFDERAGTQVFMDTYSSFHVTGVDRNNKRFKIVTDSPHHAFAINLFNGTVWGVTPSGFRRMIRRVSQ